MKPSVRYAQQTGPKSLPTSPAREKGNVMSTENIAEEAEEARRALGQAAAATRRRAQEVRDAMRGLDVERNNVVIGARAAMRSIDDENEELEEEVEQLRSILEGIDLAPRPTRMVPRAEEEAANDDDIIVQPAPPIPTPVPVVNPDDAPRRPHRANPRRWRFWAWLFAIAGLLVCMMVASNSWEPLVGDISGFGRGMLATCWWVGWTGLGFFGGGVIGSTIDDRE